MAMGDYGWSMNFDTSQGIDAVEYGRVLEYPKKRNKISDHDYGGRRENLVFFIYRASRDLAVSSLLSTSGSAIGPDRPTAGRSETT